MKRDGTIGGEGDRVLYLCPHEHNSGCNCRKPLPGMLLHAAEENDLDIKKCVVIGDRWTDLCDFQLDQEKL